MTVRLRDQVHAGLFVDRADSAHLDTTEAGKELAAVGKNVTPLAFTASLGFGQGRTEPGGRLGQRAEPDSPERGPIIDTEPPDVH